MLEKMQAGLEPSGSHLGWFSAFLSIFAANVVLLDFFVDCEWILVENAMENLMFFPGRSRIFSNMATLTKHCILRYESYFSVF